MGKNKKEVNDITQRNVSRTKFILEAYTLLYSRLLGTYYTRQRSREELMLSCSEMQPSTRTPERRKRKREEKERGWREAQKIRKEKNAM